MGEVCAFLASQKLKFHSKLMLTSSNNAFFPTRNVTLLVLIISVSFHNALLSIYAY